jgi:hypothetical protein
MKYISCENCGVVVDFHVSTMNHEEIYNHDFIKE